LMIATGAYLIDVPLQFLAPSVAEAISPIVVVPLVTIAEVSMVCYLLIKGVRTAPADPKTPVDITPVDRPLVMS
jgi:hypothetical protein